MADGYARVTGGLGVCSVHQGPGLTNTMTGLAEAAKSRTPVLVLAGETQAAALTSNFRIDQHDLVESVGAIADRVHGPATAADDARARCQRALIERRPVVLMLPIDIQAQPALQTVPSRPPLPDIAPAAPDPGAITARGRPARHRAQASDHRRPRRRARRRRPGPRAPRREDRGGPRHLGSGERPVRRPPLRARDLRRVRQPVRGRGAAASGRGAGRRRVREPLDDQARWLIDSSARVIQVDVEPRAMAATGPPTWRSRRRPGDRAGIDPELIRRGHGDQGFRTADLAAEIAPGAWRQRAIEDARPRSGSTPNGIIAINKKLPRTSRRRRLGTLPRLPGDVPRRAGCPRLGVPERLPGSRARPRKRDRRRDRSSRRAYGRGDRRRGAFMASPSSKPRPPQTDAAGRDRRRRGVRRRGAPLRADGARRLARALPGR